MPDNSAPPFVDPHVPPPPQRTRGCSNGGSHASWAIFLILFGVVLFLSNLGLFPIQHFWKYWPLYLVILGVSKLISGQPRERGAGVVLTAVGSIFFASNQGWFHFRSGDWVSIAGIILIVAGIVSFQAARGDGPTAFAARRARRDARRFGYANAFQQPFTPGQPFTAGQPFTPGQPFTHQQPFTPGRSDAWLRDSAVFGGIKRRVDTNQFAGGDIEAVFGSLDLDMRNAAMPPAQTTATLHVKSAFGAIKLRIPQHWRVSLQVAGAFGAAEDKTIPIPRTDIPPSTLIVTGSSAFGAVEIEN
jgi:hypothetical protein